jgi:ribose transport system substrate-binding protein
MIHHLRHSSSRPSRRRLGVLLAAVPCFAAAACGGVTTDHATAPASGSCKPSQQKVIGFDYPLTGLAVYTDLKRFADAEAKKRGYTVHYTADNTDVQTQEQNVSNWVTQKIPAIVTLPLDPATMETVAKQAQQQCIPVVTYGNPLKTQDASIRLSTRQSGIALGKAALTWAGTRSGPNKALILNYRELNAGAERDDGLKSVFPGNNPNITVIATQEASTQAQGEDVTRTQLQAHPDINMVLAFDDDVALGAEQAFINAGRDGNDPNIFIGGQDGSKAGLQAVQKGGIYRVTIAVRISTIGKAVADTPIDLLSGKKTSGIDVPAVPIVKDSPQLSEYLSDYS